MPGTTRQTAEGHNHSAPTVSTANASACCALSHQSNTLNCKCAGGSSASAVTTDIAKNQIKRIHMLAPGQYKRRTSSSQASQRKSSGMRCLGGAGCMLVALGLSWAVSL